LANFCQIIGSKLVGNLNVFLKISIERAEFFFEIFGIIENKLIYAKAAQVLQYIHIEDGVGFQNEMQGEKKRLLCLPHKLTRT
jgi:hypothetical protein